MEAIEQLGVYIYIWLYIYILINTAISNNKQNTGVFQNNAAVGVTHILGIHSSLNGQMVIDHDIESYR